MWSRAGGLSLALGTAAAAAAALIAHTIITGEPDVGRYALSTIVLMLVPLALYAMHRLRTRRRRAEVRACLAASAGAGEVIDIAAATDGRARIRGRVERVLRAPDESGCAAYLRRRVTMDVLETRDCGRFLVHDGTGGAVVDPYTWQIARADGRLLTHTRDAALEVRVGDEVEIVGEAQWIEAEDLGEVPVLRIDGNDVRPATILVHSAPLT